MTVRTDTFLSTPLPALAAALLLALSPALAQDAAPLDAPAGPGVEAEAISESAAVAAIVHGLAADDLLNIRATASPIGLVLARVPNGSSVTRFECAEVRGNEWCRVELPGLEGMLGWTPARYLRVALPDGEETAELPQPLPRPEPIDAAQITVGILPDPLPSVPVLVEPEETGPEIQTVLLAPSTDADGNRVPTLDAAREAKKIDGASAQLALALAVPSDPATIALYTAGDDAPDAAGAAPAEPVVPIPTPRPARAEDAGGPALASAQDAELTVAALAPSGTDAAPDGQRDPFAAVAPAADGSGSPSVAAAPPPAAATPADPARATSETLAPSAGQARGEAGSAVPSESGSPPNTAAAQAASTVAAPAPASGSPAAGTAAEPAAPAASDRAMAAADPAPPATVPAPAAIVAPAAAGTDRTQAAVSETQPDAQAQAAVSGTQADAPAQAGRGWREQIASLLPSWGEPANAAPQPAREAPAAAPAPAMAPPVAASAPAVSPPAAAQAVAAAPPVASSQMPAQASPVPLPLPAQATQPAGAQPAAAAVAAPVAIAAAPVTWPQPPAAPRPAPAVPVQATVADDATAGAIPCARYVGQPMTRCAVSVARLNGDDADVTVVWPDGGTRIIRFRAGRAEGANSRNEFRATREAELNLIRIGAGERFEILDGVIYAE